MSLPTTSNVFEHQSWTTKDHLIVPTWLEIWVLFVIMQRQSRCCNIVVNFKDTNFPRGTLFSVKFYLFKTSMSHNITRMFETIFFGEKWKIFKGVSSTRKKTRISECQKPNWDLVHTSRKLNSDVTSCLLRWKPNTKNVEGKSRLQKESYRKDLTPRIRRFSLKLSVKTFSAKLSSLGIWKSSRRLATNLELSVKFNCSAYWCGGKCRNTTHSTSKQNFNALCKKCSSAIGKVVCTRQKL